MVTVPGVRLFDPAKLLIPTWADGPVLHTAGSCWAISGELAPLAAVPFALLQYEQLCTACSTFAAAGARAGVGSAFADVTADGRARDDRWELLVVSSKLRIEQPASQLVRTPDTTGSTGSTGAGYGGFSRPKVGQVFDVAESPTEVTVDHVVPSPFRSVLADVWEPALRAVVFSASATPGRPRSTMAVPTLSHVTVGRSFVAAAVPASLAVWVVAASSFADGSCFAARAAFDDAARTDRSRRRTAVQLAATLWADQLANLGAAGSFNVDVLADVVCCAALVAAGQR